jgi:hypothetical protein
MLASKANDANKNPSIVAETELTVPATVNISECPDGNGTFVYIAKLKPITIVSSGIKAIKGTLLPL